MNLLPTWESSGHCVSARGNLIVFPDNLQSWKIKAKLEVVLLDFRKAGGKGVVTGSWHEPLALLGSLTYIISFIPKNNPMSRRELNIQ